jgi:hypothetical protein
MDRLVGVSERAAAEAWNKHRWHLNDKGCCVQEKSRGQCARGEDGQWAAIHACRVTCCGGAHIKTLVHSPCTDQRTEAMEDKVKGMVRR